MAPGESSGPSGVDPAYPRPLRALIASGIGFVVVVGIVALLPAIHPAIVTLPLWAVVSIDLLVVSGALVLAAVVAARPGGGRVAIALGVSRWSWWDLLAGISLGLVLRAVVEIVTPTTGTLLGPLVVDATAETVATTIVLVLGLALVSPVAEELFFRGALQRSASALLRGAGRVLASIAAVTASTGAFVLLHTVSVGAAVSITLLGGTVLTGLACGIATVITGRLGTAITAHVTYNLIGVVLLLL